MSEFERNLGALPFLRWAGGKRRLAGRILDLAPPRIERYYEPFLGAGSVFFSLDPGLKKFAGDFNSELISVYQALRDNLPEVISELALMNNSRDEFYAVRAWDRLPEFARLSQAKRAARFIFLNKHGFNGLYRVNSLGQYNVPYGGSSDSNAIDLANLSRVSCFLSKTDPEGRALVELSTGDYLSLTKTVVEGPGSLVYLDPPYHPTSKTSNFVDYNENGFNEENQFQLRDEALRLSSLGVSVMLSNSDTEFIREIYSGPEFLIHTLDVRRVIAARPQDRKQTTELLITSFLAGGT